MFLGPFKLPCSFPSKTIGVVLAVLLLVVWKEREREREREEGEREREHAGSAQCAGHVR